MASSCASLPRDRVEVAIEILYIDRHVGHRLGAVDQNGYTVRMGQCDHFPDGVDRSQGVGNMPEGDELGTFAQKLFVGPSFEVAGFIQWHDDQFGAGLLAEHLPGNDVGVMFHLGDEDLVIAADMLASPGLCHQVDRFGRIAGDDDFPRIRGLVHAAMDARVFIGVEVGHAIDDHAWLLGARRTVEKDQGLAPHGLFENREITAHGFDVERPHRITHGLPGGHCVAPA